MFDIGDEDVRRRSVDDDVKPCGSNVSTSSAVTRLEAGMVSGADDCVACHRLREKRNAFVVRFRWESVTFILAVVQTMLAIVAVTAYSIAYDDRAHVQTQKCRLPFGDTLLRNNYGYDIVRINGLGLYSRRENASVVTPTPCNVSFDLEAEGRVVCLTQTFLYHQSQPYYAFRLFTGPRGHFVVQGAIDSKVGDWISITNRTLVQVVLRTDFSTGHWTLGYPPIPSRARASHAASATLFVDGSVRSLTTYDA